jgi:hypothetical protein
MSGIVYFDAVLLGPDLLIEIGGQAIAIGNKAAELNSTDKLGVCGQRPRSQLGRASPKQAKPAPCSLGVGSLHKAR